MKKNEDKVKAANRAIIGQLQPAKVFEHFLLLCNVARGSGNEEEIVGIIMNMAKSMDYHVSKDSANNLLVRIPASSGYEHLPSICLQSHVDMVLEKAKGMSDEDIYPIELTLNGDVLGANGTTLGMDNGGGVAMMMAIMEDTTIKHGKLELLFTSDEERGMDGVKAFDYSKLESKKLINLDSEDWGQLFIGCAGGSRITGTFKPEYVPAPNDYTPMRITISGLESGHSGLDIHRNRANAVKCMVLVLNTLTNIGAQVATVSAGSKFNLIPKNAEAVIMVPSDHLDATGKVFGNIANILRMSFPDEKINITLTKEPTAPTQVISIASMQKFLLLLHNLPSGVIYPEQNPKFVRTSCNLASITTGDKGVFSVTLLYRSSSQLDLDQGAESIRFAFKIIAETDTDVSSYSPWIPNYDSELLNTAVSVFKEMFSKAPDVGTIHAGLECAEINTRTEGRLDIISFGPTILGAHTINERAHVSTVEKCWNFLLALLIAE